MGRPLKKGLDYFPFETETFNQWPMRRLKRVGGNDAVVLYLQLLCDAYKNSYYIELTHHYLFDLSEKTLQEEASILSHINLMCSIGLFDAATYAEHGVLTSHEIQERYLFVKERNKSCAKIGIHLYKVEKKEETLVPPVVKPVSGAETPVSPEETPVNTSESTESKEKKNNLSKVDNSFKASCTRYRTDLLADTEWRTAMLEISGKGEELFRDIPDAMRLFEAHIISIGAIDTILSLSDYARRFSLWWRCFDYQSAEKILCRKNSTQHRNKPPTSAGSKLDEALHVSENAINMALQIFKNETNDGNEA